MLSDIYPMYDVCDVLCLISAELGLCDISEKVNLRLLTVPEN